MTDNIERILIDENQISDRLDVLSQKVLAEVGEEELIVILLLKGALVFASDLCRRLPIPLQIECLNVSSYNGGVESSGKVEFLDARLPDVKGKSVLLIDDILDTGRTLHAVSARLRELGAAQLKKCVLLSKDKQRAEVVEADYVGFTISDEFVVGYGLDFQGQYRNLPYVGVLKQIEE